MSQPELQLAIQDGVRAALKEDLFGEDARLDITAQLIPEQSQSRASIITREDAVICGCAWVDQVFRQMGQQVEIEWLVKDGDNVKANTELCR
ncbi:MAG: nicotinate-nucleotide diphosphorylase (carboxylating), partial [Idiomarina sp.]|nr:nicotinate-nucleotide diphosphorylase (carboxylating) [Idiomarina sp.]